MKEGTIKQVSPYGFRIEGNDDWFNIVKDKQKDLSKILREYIGDKIGWEENEKGAITALIIKDEKVEGSPSLMIKIISGNNYEDITKQYNAFAKSSLICYTQSLSVASDLIIICYYEPKN